MTASFVLLTRLLLCLSLVLNGTGSAMVPMQAMTDGHVAMAVEDGAHATPAHAGMAMHAQHPGHAGMATVSCHDAPPPPAGCGDAGQHHGGGKGGGKDSCCTSSASCHCPHAQPLPALAAIPLPLSPVPRLAVPAVRQHERGAPGLPRLDRPPIA